MNVQGLGDQTKRCDILSYLRIRKYNIKLYCIQDTCTHLWGFECYFSNLNSHSSGIAILINNTFDFKFKSFGKDMSGNLLILNFTSYDSNNTPCLHI